MPAAPALTSLPNLSIDDINALARYVHAVTDVENAVKACSLVERV